MVVPYHLQLAPALALLVGAELIALVCSALLTETNSCIVPTYLTFTLTPGESEVVSVYLTSANSQVSFQIPSGAVSADDLLLIAQEALSNDTGYIFHAPPTSKFLGITFYASIFSVCSTATILNIYSLCRGIIFKRVSRFKRQYVLLSL